MTFGLHGNGDTEDSSVLTWVGWRLLWRQRRWVVDGFHLVHGCRLVQIGIAEQRIGDLVKFRFVGSTEFLPLAFIPDFPKSTHTDDNDPVVQSGPIDQTLGNSDSTLGIELTSLGLRIEQATECLFQMAGTGVGEFGGTT